MSSADEVKQARQRLIDAQTDDIAKRAIEEILCPDLVGLAMLASEHHDLGCNFTITAKADSTLDFVSNEDIENANVIVDEFGDEYFDGGVAITFRDEELDIWFKDWDQACGSFGEAYYMASRILSRANDE